MNTPVISIIIPAFNTAKYLDKCVGSVCGQTFRDIEIIIINDGSTDDTPVICNKWAEKDERIKVFHTPNNGVAEARNIGLKNAQGQFIGFVDADDWIEADMFEVLYNSIQKHHSDISICGAYVQTMSGNTHRISLHAKQEKIWGQKEALKRLLMDHSIKNYLWDKLYRKELFCGITFPTGQLFEDQSVLYKLFEKASLVSHTGKSLYHYIQHEGSVLGTYNPKTEMDYYHSQLAFYHYIINKKDFSPSEKKILASFPIKNIIITLYKLQKSSYADDYKAEQYILLSTLKEIYRKNYNPAYYRVYRFLLSSKNKLYQK